MVRIGIIGYGNLGRGVENAVAQNDDMELSAIFTRRNPSEVKTVSSKALVLKLDEIENYADKIDVMILCGGSATDLPEQTAKYARIFNVVDSFDTHAKIPEHFEAVEKAAKSGRKTAIISAGWDPGMFSINRLYADSVLPDNSTYTFWGKGVSQGHSDAIRRINGVKNAVQYTIPKEKALEAVRSGQNPSLSTREKHLRECFVVLKNDVDKAKVEADIITMPNYFADYDTLVHFISDEEFKKNHTAMPHGGFVIASGKTGEKSENSNVIEYSLKLDSNPEFTAMVLTACARAAYKLSNEGNYGCKTVFDIAPSYLSKKSAETLRREML